MPDTALAIHHYIEAIAEPKRGEMHLLHSVVLALMPACKLWWLDGKDERGKTVSNPSIGYGTRTLNYANGKAREFYQIGISANTAGISVYILGIEDKNFLTDTYGKQLGKASVSGYCIKFKRLKDIDLEVLQTAIRDAVFC